MPSEEEALQAVRTLLAYIGDDPARPGLDETPQRVLKAWREDWGAGYSEPLKPLVKLFPDALGPVVFPMAHSMVIVDDIGFHSHCEHHMAPFSGTAAVAYIPDKRGAIGLSKLARIVDHFSRRLQVQERLTEEIATFLAANVAKDCAVLLRASHSCMTSRGARQPHSITTTSALRGALFHDHKARSEFLTLTRRGRFACD